MPLASQSRPRVRGVGKYSITDSNSHFASGEALAASTVSQKIQCTMQICHLCDECVSFQNPRKKT